MKIIAKKQFFFFIPTEKKPTKNRIKIHRQKTSPNVLFIINCFSFLLFVWKFFLSPKNIYSCVSIFLFLCHDEVTKQCAWKKLNKNFLLAVFSLEFFEYEIHTQLQWEVKRYCFECFWQLPVFCVLGLILSCFFGRKEIRRLFLIEASGSFNVRLAFKIGNWTESWLVWGQMSHEALFGSIFFYFYEFWGFFGFLGKLFYDKSTKVSALRSFLRVLWF